MSFTVCKVIWNVQGGTQAASTARGWALQVVQTTASSSSASKFFAYWRMQGLAWSSHESLLNKSLNFSFFFHSCPVPVFNIATLSFFLITLQSPAYILKHYPFLRHVAKSFLLFAACLLIALISFLWSIDISLFIFYFFVFFGLHLWHTEVPRLGVQSEL